MVQENAGGQQGSSGAAGAGGPTESELAAMAAAAEARAQQGQAAQGGQGGGQTNQGVPDFESLRAEFGGVREGISKLPDALGAAIDERIGSRFDQFLNGLGEQLKPMTTFVGQLMQYAGSEGGQQGAAAGAGEGQPAAGAAQPGAQNTQQQQANTQELQSMRDELYQLRFMTDYLSQLTAHQANEERKVRETGDPSQYVPAPSKAATAAILNDPNIPAREKTPANVFKMALELEQKSMGQRRQIEEAAVERFKAKLVKQHREQAEEIPDFSDSSPMMKALTDSPFDPSVPVYEDPAVQGALNGLADRIYGPGGNGDRYVEPSHTAPRAQRSYMPQYPYKDPPRR